MGPSRGSGIHTSDKDRNMVHSKNKQTIKQTNKIKQRKVNRLIDTERGVRLEHWVKEGKGL